MILTFGEAPFKRFARRIALLSDKSSINKVCLDKLPVSSVSSSIIPYVSSPPRTKSSAIDAPIHPAPITRMRDLHKGICNLPRDDIVF